MAGERVDRILAALLGLSRGEAQRWIESGQVTLSGKTMKASMRLKGGEELTAREPPRHPSHLQPEAIPLVILYEDEALLVVEKPRGLVVHPSAGHRAGTLVNALLAHTHLSGGSAPQRPGIVHRLDKDTSGLMLVAKTDQAHGLLAAQFAERTVTKTYLALAHGLLLEEEGRIEVPLRHDVGKLRVEAAASGKRASTEFRLLKRYPQGYSLLELHPETGRTHQLRVHLAFIGHPVVGDPLYAPSNPWKLAGQMLHASQLRFRHPNHLEEMTFHSSLPTYFLDILETLETGPVGQ
ncbi:MAG: RluA family pseudouridine synthase [bacterium]